MASVSFSNGNQEKGGRWEQEQDDAEDANKEEERSKYIAKKPGTHVHTSRPHGDADSRRHKRATGLGEGQRLTKVSARLYNTWCQWEQVVYPTTADNSIVPKTR